MNNRKYCCTHPVIATILVITIFNAAIWLVSEVACAGSWMAFIGG